MQQGQTKLKRTLNAGYGGVQAAYWMFYGVSNSFASAFLLPRGYSNTEIGIILAAANVIAVFLQPAMADVADRSRRVSLIGITQICTILTMALEAVLFITERKSAALYVIFVMIVAWQTALQPLINSLCFKLEESGVHINFGMCRSFGSLGYSLLCAILGTLVEKFGSGVLPISGEAVLFALLIALLVVKSSFDGAMRGNGGVGSGSCGESREDRQRGGESYGKGSYGSESRKPQIGSDRKNGEKPERSLGEEPCGETCAEPYAEPCIESCEEFCEEINLWRFVRENKLFLVLNIGVVGIYFSNAVLNSFMLQIVTDVGGSNEQMGRVLSLMAFLEIPALFFFDKIRARFSCVNILKFAAICFGLKVGLIYLAKSMGLIYGAHIFQTFGFGLFLPAMVAFTGEAMRKGEAVKGQALFSAMSTVSATIASIFGGILLDISGAKFMLLVSTGITALGAVVIILTAGKIRAK